MADCGDVKEGISTLAGDGVDISHAQSQSNAASAGNVEDVSDRDQEHPEACCKICLKTKSRYTCPRCNIPYCSVDCYKSVSHAECSEGFYRDCFMEGLKDMKGPGDKTKVMEMLKRVSEQENPLDSDDEEDDDLCERLEGVDLDEDVDLIWSKLNAKEKAEFNSMMDDGRLGELVDVWKPWWCLKKEPTLIEDISTDQHEESEDSDDSCSESSHCDPVRAVPAIRNDIPDIAILLKNKSPSENIKYNLINLIYSYIYMNRLYNGDYRDIPEQSAVELLTLCSSLGVENFTSTETAIDGCIQLLTSRAKSLFISQEFSVGILQDMLHLLSSPTSSDLGNYVLAMLSDVLDLLEQALQTIRSSKKKVKGLDALKSQINCTTTKDLKQRLFSACKKCEFFLAWTKTYAEKLRSCSVDIEIMFCEMTSRIAHHKKTGDYLKKLQNHIPRKGLCNLIEEIPANDSA